MQRPARFAVSIALVLAARALADPLPLPELHWRLLGPFRGGWATVAAGVPDAPDTFYFGAAGGGVWKTENAGRTWSPISDAAGIVSVGALAIAPSNPSVIYVGSGQPEPRYDVAAGDGVWKSTDGGRSWTHLGLQGARHIGAILVDPRDADVVTVAALGHWFGPNPERGVYQSRDGGQTWNHVLAIDEQTGAVDLAADPRNPDLLYAAVWQARAWPWLSYFTPLVGKNSGIYRSRDGGRTWQRLTGGGWPSGALGRIGLAVTDAAGGVRVYATLDAEKEGGVWRSDDGGDTWTRVNDDADTFGNWYFSRLTVDPRDPDTLYAMGQSIRRSRDGGKTWTEIKGAPGGDDYHFLWIDPQHPERWIAASDQGATVSVDGGRSWSSWYNQPTGQFYRLATDRRFPYWIYSGQQDSGTVAIASRSDYGGIGARDWHPVGGDERDADLPDPNDPDIVYGSGLGGRISRWDARTGQVKNVSPWPVSSYGARPTTVKYRYTWIAPLAATRRALYAGAQVLFESRDRGEHWRVISPDLTGKERNAKDCQGEVVIAAARACGYGVIYSIEPSPRDERELWVGTDDGLVWLTRDAGAHWQNVTPQDLPVWARINSVAVSALEAGVAYLVADNHRQDDFAPHAWRTRDYGRTWQPIAAGLPAGHFVSVLRADPEKRGLLYAGTDEGVYVSFDDGAHWQSLQLDLPHAWIRDLQVHGDDLIAATQGRAIWVLDDLTPLRQLSAAATRAPLRLFAPATAYRVHANNNKDTPLPPEEPLGENPPAGAVFDYWIGAPPSGPLRLEIYDAQNRLVRRYASDEPPPRLKAARYFAPEWLKPAPRLSAAPGMHRFVWDLRWPRPRALKYEYSIAAVFGLDTPLTPQGPYALPGRYVVVLKDDQRSVSAPLTVVLDPRVSADEVALRDALDFSQAVGQRLEQAYAAATERQALRQQLATLDARLENDAAHADLRREVQALNAALAGKPETAESDETPDLAAIGDALAALETDLESADGAPTAGQRALLADYGGKLDARLAEWRKLRDTELPRLDARLRAAGLPPVTIPPPQTRPADPAPAGKDWP